MRSDARQSTRYDVQLSCEVISPFQAFAQMSGTTLNMSRTGMLLSLATTSGGDAEPRVGHAARILLRLPGNGSSRARCVECLGRVVRLEGETGSRRVAFEFRRFLFTELVPQAN